MILNVVRPFKVASYKPYFIESLMVAAGLSLAPYNLILWNNVIPVPLICHSRECGNPVGVSEPRFFGNLKKVEKEFEKDRLREWREL